jgi:hypothetical protein
MQKKTTRKNTQKGPWNYFPDCHICSAVAEAMADKQAMKQGRGNTAEDLTKVFAEAETLKNKSS